MKKRRESSPPPVPPRPVDDPHMWKVVIEPGGLWPWTPYRVRLKGGWAHSWGWSCITLAGARRRGRRELARERARFDRVQRIQRRIDDTERSTT